MANSILTPTMVTRAAIPLFKNSNAFLGNINSMYSDQFAKTGAKIGYTLNVRIPNDYTVRTGPTAAPQSTNERSVPLVLATQMGVDISFSSVERTMSIQDFSTRVLEPAMNNLAAGVALAVMSLVETIPNWTANVGTGAYGASSSLTPTLTTLAMANAVLNAEGAPTANRKAMLQPDTDGRLAAALATLYNPQPTISKQYDTGQIRRAMNIDFMMDQVIPNHLTGTATGNTVNGANQTGSAITVTATTGTFAAGDIITIAGVNAVNRLTKQSRNVLRKFVVTAPVPAGSTSIPIYPSLSPAVGGVQQQFQTVDVSPANGAAIALINPPSEVYRKNFAFHRDAFTIAFADLEMPPNVEGHRESQDGVSMRFVTQYQGTSDQLLSRIDILFGFAALRPEWAVVIPDSIT